MKKILKEIVVLLLMTLVIGVYAKAIINCWALGIAIFVTFAFLWGAYDGGKFEWED